MQSWSAGTSRGSQPGGGLGRIVPTWLGNTRGVATSGPQTCPSPHLLLALEPKPETRATYTGLRPVWCCFPSPRDPPSTSLGTSPGPPSPILGPPSMRQPPASPCPELGRWCYTGELAALQHGGITRDNTRKLSWFGGFCSRHSVVIRAQESHQHCSYRWPQKPMWEEISGRVPVTTGIGLELDRCPCVSLSDCACT